MGKAKLEFIARITTEDGREIECKEEQNIPSPEEVDIHNLDNFLRTFDEYERNTLSARNKICEDITQAWLDDQEKGGRL
ncbi:MAG: hypothetical protein HUK12_06675 [Muribaculaceae bacterium]|nr:hypothetical protein [Muribaculaceae bacterium]